MEEGILPNPASQEREKIYINPNQSPGVKPAMSPVSPINPSAPLQAPLPPSSSPMASNGGGFFSKNAKILKIAFVFFILLTVFLSIMSFLPKGSKVTKESKVTLTYWTFENDKELMAPVISDFEKENPNIKIDYSFQDEGDYLEKLKVRIPNGNGPDLFRFHNTWYPLLKNELLPLPKEIIEKKEFENNYYSVIQSDLIKNGAIYGIPLRVDVLVLFINPQIFDAASSEQNLTIKIPETWQEFIDAAQALTKRNEDGVIDISGAAIGSFENINNAPDIISLLFAQNGVNMNDFSESKEKISAALRFYTNFSLLEDNVWDESMDQALNVFANGKLAMYFGYAKDYATIKSLNPNISIKMVPIPQLSSERKFAIANYYAEGVSSGSSHQKEALQFIKFLARPETQEKIYQEQTKSEPIGRPYSNKTLVPKLTGTDFYIFQEEANFAISSPFTNVPINNDLNVSLNERLGNAIDSVLKGTDSDSAADAIQQGYSEVILNLDSPPLTE